MTMVDDFELLEKNGFRLIPYKTAKNEKQALKAADDLGYPVAMKIISKEIEHKTDVGGVKTGIKSPEVLKIAYAEMMENAKGFEVDGVLIQKMARKGVELIIGGKKDPQFGHMVVLGIGGIYVEIFKDVSARICPVEGMDVEEMISELKSHPIIDGARGERPLSKKAIQELVLKTCKFMIKKDIKEMDLNPVICDHSGCDIVDVRFRR
ncbi:acetate--CoA ligase family protein [Candidatus Micrarchaeota archaeon]|nr:acetate--CoA ligase family protein [Candidatus Micrarchaeota archaeon]